MKNVLKRRLSVLLAITIIFSSALVRINEIDFIGLFAVEADAASECDLTFTFNDDFTYTVTDCSTHATGSLVIPSKVNNTRVTSIGDCAFQNCKNLTSVTIPDGVTKIGGNAFRNCTNLTAVTVPQSVTKIGPCAFTYYCLNLVSINVNANNSNYSSMDGVLFNKNKTELIQYPAGKTNTSYVIPDSVKVIDSYVFRDCSHIESITIPESVTYVGDYVFLGCSTLKYIFYGSDSVTWEALSALYGSSLKDVKIHYNATGHTYDSDWIVENESSCSVAGKKYNVCSVCGDNFYESLPLAEHNASDWIIDKEALCDEFGEKHKECIECKTILETTEISPLGHIYSEDWSIDKESSCTELGEKSRHCIRDNCEGKTDITEIPTIEHEWADEWVIDKEPECTTVGLKSHHCINCNAKTDVTEIVAKGHNCGEWFIFFEPTCTENGLKAIECTECGEVLETETIPQLKCSKPVLKKVYNANSYVKVTWGAVEGADLYRVYRKTGTGNYEYIGSTSKTYFNDKEAGAGKTCRYRIRAKNEAGYSEYSASTAIKHIDEPTLKSIENSAYGVLIKWNKVTGAEKYNVYRKVSGGEYKYIGATSNTYYTDKTAESGTKYYYAIRGKRDDSVSSQSASLSKYYLADPTLNTPTSTSKGIGLRWTEVAGAEGYMVYRKTDSGSYSKLATVKGSTKVTYTDSSAKKGTKYTYKIKAYKSKTYSAYSNAKAITDKY